MLLVIFLFAPCIDNILIKQAFSLPHFLNVLEPLIFTMLLSKVTESRPERKKIVLKGILKLLCIYSLSTQFGFFHEFAEVILALSHFHPFLSSLFLSALLDILFKHLFALFGGKKQITWVENYLVQLFFPSRKCRDLKKVTREYIYLIGPLIKKLPASHEAWS